LAVGALLGPDLELKLLGRVNELSHEQLVDVLDEASEGGFIAETDRTLGIYGFRHALIRETLVDRLSAARRAHCHQQIATALDATEPEARLSELAHHLLAAAPLAGSAARARAYALRAAEQATARLAYDEAARQLRVALAAIDQEPAPSEAQRCDILIALGEAELRTGETDTARRVFDEAVASARRLDDARGLARAALGTAGARPRLGLGAADTGAMTVLDDALSALGAADSPLRVRVLSRLATELYWSKDRERGNQLTREALTVARRVGEPSALASSLHAAFVHDDHPDSLSRRSELAGEIRALALRSNDPRIGIWAEHFTVIEALELGDIANADAALARYTELAEQLRHPMHRWHATMWAAMRHLLAGRFDLAERSALEAHAAGERAQDLNVQQTVAVQLATVRWEQGRSHEFIPALRTTIERDRAVPAWRAALALSYADCDDRVHARETLESLASDNFETLPRDSMWLGAVALLAETCGYLGDVERAATLTHLLEPYAKRVIVVGNARVCMGSASHYLGVLGATRGDLRDAAHHFEASIEVDEHLQAPPRVARSQYAYARLLLARNERGDKDRARELLDRAQNAARELGMRRLLAQICATRGLSGIRRPATAARDGPDHGAPPEAASAIV
jgi:tetratricopeptide (TPR) repeat protein